MPKLKAVFGGSAATSSSTSTGASSSSDRSMSVAGGKRKLSQLELVWPALARVLQHCTVAMLCSICSWDAEVSYFCLVGCYLQVMEEQKRHKAAAEERSRRDYWLAPNIIVKVRRALLLCCLFLRRLEPVIYGNLLNAAPNLVRFHLPLGYGQEAGRRQILQEEGRGVLVRHWCIDWFHLDDMSSSSFRPLELWQVLSVVGKYVGEVQLLESGDKLRIDQV